MTSNLPRRVLAVGAHPDDIEILCAGTMARYAEAGSQVILCTATNGDLGSSTLPKDEIGRVRIAEAKEAANVIGAEFVCLDFGDGTLDGTSLTARERFIELIRQTRPDVVFTHDPADYHADHVATSKLVFDATFMSSVPLVRTAIGPTDKILPVVYMDTLAGIGFAPEEYVDITGTFETKRAMLSRHVSQVEWMSAQGGLNLLEFAETMSRFRGIQCDTLLAEAFRPAHSWFRDRTSRLLP